MLLLLWLTMHAPRRPLRCDCCSCAIKVMSKLQFKTEQDHKDMLTEVELFARVKGHPNGVSWCTTREFLRSMLP